MDDNATFNFSMDQAQDFTARRYGGLMSVYVLPVIIFMGLILNAISCMVFTSQELKNYSSSVYIFALLVSDTGVLIGLLFIWLEAIGFRVNHMNGMCQGLVFFTYVFSFLSVWYVVCITVENYITICQPTRYNRMCTKRRATIVVSCILILSLLMYAVTAFAAEVTHNLYARGARWCSHRPELMPLMYVLTYVDSVVTLLVPLLVISGMMVTISVSILHTSRWKKRLSSLPMLDVGQLRTSTDFQRGSSVRPNVQVRVAKMLYALSVSYIVMNAPSHITRLYYLLRPKEYEDNHVTYSEGLIQLVLQYMTYAHHASKFWIFVIFSKNFVRSLKQMFFNVVNCRSYRRS